MKTIEMNKATGSLADYARDIDKEPVILTVHNKPVAALVSLGNADWESLSLSTNSKFIALIERSRSRQRAEGGISPEEMRRRLGLKPARRRKTT